MIGLCDKGYKVIKILYDGKSDIDYRGYLRFG